MPAVINVSKEQIIDAALEVLRDDGEDELHVFLSRLSLKAAE